MEVILERLRAMATLNPANRALIEAQRTVGPVAPVYLVHTEIQGAYVLWDHAPKAFQAALLLHNQCLRKNMENFQGYEVWWSLENCGFQVAFERLRDALNFCIGVQASLLLVSWPEELLEHPKAAEMRAEGTVVWRGPRVRMSVHGRDPVCEFNHVTGCMTYVWQSLSLVC